MDLLDSLRLLLNLPNFSVINFYYERNISLILPFLLRQIPRKVLLLIAMNLGFHTVMSKGPDS